MWQKQDLQLTWLIIFLYLSFILKIQRQLKILENVKINTILNIKWYLLWYITNKGQNKILQRNCGCIYTYVPKERKTQIMAHQVELNLLNINYFRQLSTYKRTTNTNSYLIATILEKNQNNNKLRRKKLHVFIVNNSL